MKNPAHFWQWFISHSEELMQIDNLTSAESEELLLLLSEQLSDYSEGISFEIGDLSPHGRTFLLTADGDADYFEPIIALFESAPELDWWTFEAFRPPQGKKASVVYEGTRYDSKNLWFIPLESPENPSQIGLQVGLKNYQKDNDNQLFGVYTLIESMIGEYDCGTLIGFLDTVALPSNLSETDFIPLEQLPDFVEWHQQNQEQGEA